MRKGFELVENVFLAEACTPIAYECVRLANEVEGLEAVRTAQAAEIRDLREKIDVAYSDDYVGVYVEGTLVGRVLRTAMPMMRTNAGFSIGGVVKMEDDHYACPGPNCICAGCLAERRWSTCNNCGLRRQFGQLNLTTKGGHPWRECSPPRATCGVANNDPQVCSECQGDGRVLEDHDGRAGYRSCSKGCPQRI